MSQATDVVGLDEADEGHPVVPGFFNRQFGSKAGRQMSKIPIPGNQGTLVGIFEDFRSGSRNHNVILDGIHIAFDVPYSVGVHSA